MYEDQTLSISISKLTPEEEMTIAGAYWKDASFAKEILRLAGPSGKTGS